MVREALNEQNKSIEIRGLDLYGRTGLELSGQLNLFIHKTVRKISVLINRKSNEEKICTAVIQEYEKQVDDNTCGIIFVGGGLIKYSHQIISQPMKLILKRADHNKIPVMLSAVGVEGYDQNSQECQKLKNALNLECVKIITTRDDLNTLTQNYIENRNIRTSKVADPACQISNIYPPSEIELRRKKVIGLGIARFDLFSDYGHFTKKEDIIFLWNCIYSELDRRGYRCLLFTNGLDADYYAAKKIFKSVNSKDIIIAKRPRNMGELTSIISHLDGIITTRLHSSIIAYSYGIPTIGLVWNEKQLMFGEATHHYDRFIEEPFNAKAIVDRLEIAMKLDDAGDVDMDYIHTTKVWIERFLRKYI